MSLFICTKCDAQASKWAGRCEECGGWGTLREEADTKNSSGDKTTARELLSVSDIEGISAPRILTNISELDHILSGGLTVASLLLLGGEPGIGKSTLLLQIIENIAQDTIYVCGEESPAQIYSRARRLNCSLKHLRFLTETDIETISATAKKHMPKLLIIDSVQTIFSNEAPSEAGSINQVRICTVKLMELAKKDGITVIITGQVTKDGMMAGPKTLEHLVDTVMYLEGDRNHEYRIARIVKNRFGATNEIALFEMKSGGLCQIDNAAAIFLDAQGNFPGSVITAVTEGNKTFLVEIQALVTKTVFGYPQRKTSGFDLNRLQLLVAVLQKRAGLDLSTFDIHLNVVNGYKLKEVAADLAVCAAIISAMTDRPLEKGAIIFGEVGLGGEIRPISHLEQRIQASIKQGFLKIYGPALKKTTCPQEYVIVQNLDFFYNKKRQSHS